MRKTKIMPTGKVIGLCIGSATLGKIIDGKRISKTTKNWFYERWLELAQKLVCLGYKVVLLGGKKEQEEFDVLNFQKDYCNSINLAGCCSILESIWIIY